MLKRDAVARIDEARCIGCALCIEACPVDAIVGAAGFMHTVIDDHCIGCDLCLPPCPVDCIAMLASPRAWTEADGAAARQRGARRKTRLTRRVATPVAGKDQRRSNVAAAIERVRIRRAAKDSHKP